MDMFTEVRNGRFGANRNPESNYWLHSRGKGDTFHTNVISNQRTARKRFWKAVNDKRLLLTSH